jgi:hypothetical protein
VIDLFGMILPAVAVIRHHLGEGVEYAAYLGGGNVKIVLQRLDIILNARNRKASDSMMRHRRCKIQQKVVFPTLHKIYIKK